MRTGAGAITLPVVNSARDPESLSILFDLFVAGQRSRRLLQRVFVGAEIRSDEYALYSLILQEGPMTPTQVADRLSMAVTTVLDHLHTMEERGHLEREPNPADGRSVRLALTPEGRRVHDVTGLLFDRAMLPLLDHLELPPADVHAALRAIDAAAGRALEEIE
jgi:DNA-binding MarR family transcriptional regulator